MVRPYPGRAYEGKFAQRLRFCIQVQRLNARRMYILSSLMSQPSGVSAFPPKNFFLGVELPPSKSPGLKSNSIATGLIDFALVVHHLH